MLKTESRTLRPLPLIAGMLSLLRGENMTRLILIFRNLFRIRISYLNQKQHLNDWQSKPSRTQLSKLEQYHSKTKTLSLAPKKHMSKSTRAYKRKLKTVRLYLPQKTNWFNSKSNTHSLQLTLLAVISRLKAKMLFLKRHKPLTPFLSMTAKKLKTGPF